MKMQGTIKTESITKLLKERGIYTGGKVQQFIDSEVIRLSDPYVPMRTGKLKESAVLGTVIGSGEVNYIAPYARKQYLENKGNGKRGKLWFERMKADKLKAILNGAAKIAGGEPDVGS